LLYHITRLSTHLSLSLSLSFPPPHLAIALTPPSSTYAQFSHHLTTNTIGPLLVAAAILKLSSPAIPIHTLVFMSSDSGSAARFRAFEDGFAAYAASKAALNQGLRHLAAELPRLESPTEGSASPNRDTVVLALHPGEVATDMASNVDLAWEVEGIITPEESVAGMLKVIAEKGKGGVGQRGGEAVGVATFWDWRGEVYPW
jgi:NAD(P)-dependent dehydrogenase (short-subunit alcohol dehydrogenase family)